MAFLAKTAFLDDFPLCPQCPPSQKRNFLFLLSSRRLWIWRDHFSGVFLCVLCPIGNRKSAPKVFLYQLFVIPGRPDPKLRDIPALPCLRQQRKAPCIKLLSGTPQGRGQGYPDMWVPDVPGISCPRALSLGCFFCPGPKELGGRKTAQEKKTNSWERRFPGTFRTNVPLSLPIFSVFSVGGGPKVPRNFVPGNFFFLF